MYQHRRVLLLAATVAAVLAVGAATPLGAAVARTLGGFSAWISGAPGTPATPAQQQAFQDANARSWAGFPAGTTLRRLIERRVDRVDYTVLGLRAGDDVCLRVATGDDTLPSNSDCVPVSALRAAGPPVVVVRADQTVWPTGEARGRSPQLASVTFGIAADGVDAVEVRTDEESATAKVVDNAFLYVASQTQRSTRVRAVESILSDGERVAVPFASAPYGTWDLPPAPTGAPLGPDHVDRSVPVGIVGWILRREPRGVEPPPDMLQRVTAGMPGQVVFARLIDIDRATAFGTLVVELEVDRRAPETYGIGGRMVCTTLVSHGQLLGGGCNSRATLLYDGPFTMGESIAEGGDQYAVLSGVANDDVAHMTLYQADGQVLPVPLRDNLYAVRALRAAYPVRLVASDSAGRVVGIKTFESDLGGSRRVRPTPGVAWRKVTTASDAQRREWSLWVAPAVGGGSCYELRTPSGTVQSGCRPSPYAGSMLAVSITGRDGDQPLLAGVVGDAVTRVAVRYPDGTAITVRPVEGYMLAALDLTGTRRSGALQLQAFDKDGVPIAQAQIELRH